MNDEKKWYLRTQDETFGPETEAQLVEWAKLGRILPGQEVSDDNLVWRRVEDVPFLDMRFSIDIGDGNPRGPFNRAAAEALVASGRLPGSPKIVEVREPFPPAEPPPETAAEPPPEDEPAAMTEAEPKVEGEPRPVVEAVESPAPAGIPEVRIVEVPVEKIVEKRVEVPVEKIVEVEKIVVDETRVKELEGLLAEERRHTGDLQTRIDDASRAAAEAARASAAREAELRVALRKAETEAAERERSLADAVDRENKYIEQVKSLEDELRRLPQAASEVADIQAAMYSIMTKEAEELAGMLEQEKREADEFRIRHQERADRLLERRRELLKRAGANIEDMTRKALINRPEDPRTAQLRREVEELRRTHERTAKDYETRLRAATEELRLRNAELARHAEGQRDITQMQAEMQELREQLQLREQELLAERQNAEQLRQQQATYQQTMMSRLAQLETPSIGTSQTLATNQSREARMVRLPGWMRLKK